MSRRILIFVISVLAAVSVSAQRRVSPVKPSDPVTITSTNDDSHRRKPESTRPASVVSQIDDTGREVLVDTITGSEYVDSAPLMQPKVIGNVYPLFHAVTVGVDLWDPLMRIFNQEYGLAGIWAELSLHNRYNPIVEFGLGSAANTPEDMNFTYKSPVAPYFKIGCNYNFLYNSNPDYQIYAGLRYGITRFSYDVTNVTVKNEYWNDNTTFNLPTQHSTTGYFEVLAGIKVKVADHWSLGWTVKYHNILHSSKAPYGNAWYIPGYGTRGSWLGASLSLMYTIPLNKKSAIPFDQINANGENTENSEDNTKHDNEETEPEQVQTTD